MIDPDEPDLFEQLKQQQRQAGIDPEADVFTQLAQKFNNNKGMTGSEDKDKPVREIKRLPDGPERSDPEALAAYTKYEQFLAEFLNYGSNLTQAPKPNLFEQLNQSQKRSTGLQYDR